MPKRKRQKKQPVAIAETPCLPRDILRHIFSFIGDRVTVDAVALASRTFYEIVREIVYSFYPPFRLDFGRFTRLYQSKEIKHGKFPCLTFIWNNDPYDRVSDFKIDDVCDPSYVRFLKIEVDWTATIDMLKNTLYDFFPKMTNLEQIKFEYVSGTAEVVGTVKYKEFTDIIGKFARLKKAEMKLKIDISKWFSIANSIKTVPCLRLDCIEDAVKGLKLTEVAKIPQKKIQFGLYSESNTLIRPLLIDRSAPSSIIDNQTLEELEILFYPEYDSDSDNECCEEDRNGMGHLPLEEMATFSNLSKLSLDGLFLLDPLLYQGLLKSSKLKKLEISDCFIADQGEFQLALNKLENLQYFRFEGNIFCQAIDPPENIEELYNHDQCNRRTLWCWEDFLVFKDRQNYTLMQPLLKLKIPSSVINLKIGHVRGQRLDNPVQYKGIYDSFEYQGDSLRKLTFHSSTSYHYSNNVSEQEFNLFSNPLESLSIIIHPAIGGVPITWNIFNNYETLKSNCSATLKKLNLLVDTIQRYENNDTRGYPIACGVLIPLSIDFFSNLTHLKLVQFNPFFDTKEYDVVYLLEHCEHLKVVEIRQVFLKKMPDIRSKHVERLFLEWVCSDNIHKVSYERQRKRFRHSNVIFLSSALKKKKGKKHNLKWLADNYVSDNEDDEDEPDQLAISAFDPLETHKLSIYPFDPIMERLFKEEEEKLGETEEEEEIDEEALELGIDIEEESEEDTDKEEIKVKKRKRSTRRP